MRTSPTHYITPSSIEITPNANNSYNDLAVYIAPVTDIKVYCPRLGIGTANGTYSVWQLYGRNRRLADSIESYASTKPHTIYARLSKTDIRDGYIVFTPKQQYNNEWYDKYSYITKDGLSISYNPSVPGSEPGVVDNDTYWYVKLGEVSAADSTNQRAVDLDTGILGTDQWNSEWALNPDALPLRIDMNYMLGTILGEEWTADVRYVRWEQVLHVNAKLIEGWTGTDITHFHHWEITRNTGSDADNTWNAAHTDIRTTETDLYLAHTRGQGDDFNGMFSAIFTFTAYEKNPDYTEGSELPQYIPLISSTFSVMAEPVESYELEVSSETVTYNPQTGEYVPAIEYDEQTQTYSTDSGVTVRVRAKDADGNIFYPTNEQIKAIDLHVYYQPIDDTNDPTELDLTNGSGTLPSAPFLAGKGVNTWLQVGEWQPEPEEEGDNIILTNRTITYIRFGAKGDTPINCYRWYKEGLTPAKPTATDSDEPAPAETDHSGADKVSPLGNWSSTVPDRPSTGEWLLWMCSSIRHGDNTRDAWSGPVCISGIKGEPGADAEDREYIYKRLNTYPFSGTVPASINTGTIPDPEHQGQRISSNDKTKNDWVPDDWSDTAMPATSSEKYVYISIRIKESGQQWGAFSSPVLWTNWGVQGADGDGVQYLYKLFNHELTDSERDSLKPSGATFNDTTKEWECDGWDDDPLAPTEEMPFCYCSVIQRINGTWGGFGKLGLWSKWAKDGESITKQSEEYRYAVTIDTVQPIQDGSPTGDADLSKWYESKDRVLPLWTAGRYFWTKTIITWSDNSKTNLYSSERNPNDGQPGQDIIVDGATVMKYAVSDSNAVRPTQWFDYDNIKSQIVPGKWLWSQATTNYKKADGSGSAGSSVNYNVSYIGTDGENAQYIYLKGTARDINSAETDTQPCEVKVNGGSNLVTLYQRGLNLVTINRQTLAKVEEAHYDTYGEAVGSQQALNPGITDLIARLNSLDDSVFVCLVSFDAIGWQRPADVTAGTYPLITALQGYGMSDLPYTAAGRYPFLFIGYKNLGKGNGHTRMRNIGAYTDVVELAAYVANGALTLKDGKDGKDGRSIVRVTEYYKASNLDGSDAQHSETAPADGQESAQGWSTDPNLADKPAAERWNEANKYLWNYEKVEYSSGVTVERTTPQILAIWTKDGAAGRGIDTIVNKYKVTDSNDTPPDREHEGGTGWRNSPVAPGQGQYLWNYEIITWVNGAPPTTYTDVQQIGYAGTDGTSVEAQYAPNSSPSAQDIHTTFQTGDKYMRTRTTGGSWSAWQKIVGEDGKDGENGSDGENGDYIDSSFNISDLLTGVDGSTPSSHLGYQQWQDGPVPTTNAMPYLWCKQVKHSFTGGSETVGTPKYFRMTGEDGKDGTSPVFADIDNEMDSVACDKEGFVVSEQDVETHVSMFRGNTLMTGLSITSIVREDTEETFTADYYGGSTWAECRDMSSLKIKVSYENNRATIIFRFLNDEGESVNNVEHFTINASAGGESKQLTFTVNGVRPGADGTNAVLYSLNPSASEIVKKKNGGTEPNSNITCSVIKTDGNSRTAVTTGFVLKTYVDGVLRMNGPVNPADVNTGIVYELYVPNTSGVLVDKETIPVVTDGTDGTSIIAQYSADGSNWHSPFQTGDVWMRTSEDGTTWGAAMKIVGENGSETDYSFGISQYKTTTNAETAPSDITTWSDSPIEVTTAKPYLWSKVVKKDGSGTASSTSYIRLTGEKGMDAIRGYADYLYSKDDQGNNRPAASASLLGKIDLLSYNSSSQYRIAVCETDGSSGYVWKGYGENDYPDGTMFVCRLDNHLYRATANGWQDEGRFKGDNAVVYKIEFTDSTFAYNPNTARNIVDIRGIVYKADGGNTTVFTGLTMEMLELYFVLENGNRERIDPNPDIITINNGAFSTNNRNGRAWNGEKTFLAILKIDGKQVADANIPKGVYGTDGAPGSRGKRGRSYYYAQPWENDSFAYLVNDSVAPYFEYLGEYYVYNPVGDVNDSISMHDMGTPSTSNPNWEQMQSKFKYLITEAIFGKFANFGAFIINDPWLFSKSGQWKGESADVDSTINYDLCYWEGLTGYADKINNAPILTFINDNPSISGESLIDDETLRTQPIYFPYGEDSEDFPPITLPANTILTITARCKDCAKVNLCKVIAPDDVDYPVELTTIFSPDTQGYQRASCQFAVRDEGEYRIRFDKSNDANSCYVAWFKLNTCYFLPNFAVNGDNGKTALNNAYGDFNGDIRGDFCYFESGTIQSANIGRKIHIGDAYGGSGTWFDFSKDTFDIHKNSYVRMVKHNGSQLVPMGYIYVDSDNIVKFRESRTMFGYYKQ